MRVLVVEDERKVAHALRDGLFAQGYEVVVAYNGEDGLTHLGNGSFDVMVLDLMLPRRDGHEVLSAMRQRGLVTPVLVLTARDSIEDRVTGLDNGADDYLVKPFAFPELLARIRALLRRGGPNAPTRLVLAGFRAS
jgi:two-component system, OmpR family, copper resistance phosphate regulon response regulator CusR